MNPSPLIRALAAAAIATAFLTGCATNPQSRIANNPEVFNSLSRSHQELASRGRITEGMSPQAVFLAWGKADYVKRSSSGGKVTETWIYNSVAPVYSASHHFGYNYGYYPGHHGHHGHHYSSPFYCYAPSVYYRSYVVGKVTLRNGKVTQWEITDS